MAATAGDGGLKFPGYAVRCVFDCQGSDQTIAHFGDANALRKHYGRVHNIWRAKARTRLKTCPRCLKGFDFVKTFDEHVLDPKKCTRVKFEKWRARPDPGSQMHIDVFALKGTWKHISPHLKVPVGDDSRAIYDQDEKWIADARGQASTQGAGGPQGMQRALSQSGQQQQQQQHPRAFPADYGAHHHAPTNGPSGHVGVSYRGMMQPPTIPMPPAPSAANSGYGAIPLGQPQNTPPPVPAMPMQQLQPCPPAAWEEPWAQDFLSKNPGSEALVDAMLSTTRPQERDIATQWNAPPAPRMPAMVYAAPVPLAQTAPQWCPDNSIGATSAAALETQLQRPGVVETAAPTTSQWCPDNSINATLTTAPDTQQPAPGPTSTAASDESQRGSFSSTSACISTPPSSMMSLQDLGLAEGSADNLIGGPGMPQPSYAHDEEQFVASPTSWLKSPQDFAAVGTSRRGVGNNFLNPMEGFVPAAQEQDHTLERVPGDTDDQWTARLQPLFDWNAQH